ncbi:MAG: hypothetical protein ACKE51_02180 [Methylococcaceae bacterium]
MNWKIGIIALLLPLLACATETELKQNGAKVLLNGMTTTVNQHGKPGAPIELSYKVPKQKNTGNTVEIELVFITHISEGELNIHIEADNGLIINDLSHSDFNIILAEKTTRYPTSIMVTSVIEGLFYVNIFVNMDANGNTLNRTFSVPVQVGESKHKLKKTGKLSADKHGKKIMVMPALEVIK